MGEITQQNFNSELMAFHKRCPDSYVMIRPDRPFDQALHRYADDDSRQNGNLAMKSWFEYLAAKSFVAIFNSWRSILKSGRSIMVVCADPDAFDIGFVQSRGSVLTPSFWDAFEQSRMPIDRIYDSEENRSRIAKIAKDCAYEIRMIVAKRATSQQVRPLREWKSTPLKDIDASNTIPELSEELRAKLGCGGSQKEAAE